MAQNDVQPDLQIIRLCARLAKFAYTSGDPGSPLSLTKNNNQAAKTALVGILGTPATALEDIANFQRYYSNSWFIPKSRQPKWFRSYAYLSHIHGRADTRDQQTGVSRKAVDRIIVGFRGTWNDPSASGRWRKENDSDEVSQPSWRSSTFTSLKSRLALSSNYGISDFYYDMLLIRTPYREGTVWKWYAYWGSLIMGMTRPSFTICRTVAKDWMTTLPNPSSNEPNHGHVHLGFWSLWASPEGFAGYNGQGDVQSEGSIIHDVRQALKSAKLRNKDVEVYVVGHSLGGAVSTFAALDIAKELEQYPKARMYHITFGSPPVGTAAFKTYFDSRTDRYQSWNISHERDLIPQCFAWCATQKGLGKLHWWSDWSSVGKTRLIRKLIDQNSPPATEGSHEVGHEVGNFEKCRLVLAGISGLVVLGVCSLLIVPTSTVWYYCRYCYYSAQREKQKGQDESKYSYGQGDPLVPAPNVGLEYHSLQTYIDLMKEDDVFEIPSEQGAAQ